jgi:hypothetical protein
MTLMLAVVSGSPFLAFTIHEALFLRVQWLSGTTTNSARVSGIPRSAAASSRMLKK